MLRTLIVTLLVAGFVFASPAEAQFFMQSRDFSGAPVRGDEPEMGMSMPGATDAELRAGVLWNLRAALNISALQCQFEPGLLTVSTYNATLKIHKDELAKAFTTLTAYFNRTAKTKREGQLALDRFSTRVYSTFSTASAQYTFCQTAAGIGGDALFTPRGQLGELARNRLRELHNSLVPWGEQRFPRGSQFNHVVLMPRLDAACWTKTGEWNRRSCGSDVQWQHWY